MLFFALFAVACSKSPTDSKELSLTGSVKLEGQTDHSGVTVALSALADPQGGYAPAELDITVLSLNLHFL